MNLTEYAKRRGVSATLISKYCRTGKLGESAQKTGKEWQINAVKADRILKGALAPSRKQKPPKNSSGSKKTGGRRKKDQTEKRETIEEAGLEKLNYYEAQTENERYKAALNKLKYEERIGQLVEAEKVKTEAYSTARRIRDALLGIPDRVAPIVAAEANPDQVHTLLTQEITQALEGFSE